MNQCGHRDFTVESARAVVQSGLRSQTGLNSSSTAVEMRTMFGCKGQESPNNRGLNQLDVHFSFLYKLRGGYFKSAAFTWFCSVLRTQAPPTLWFHFPLCPSQETGEGGGGRARLLLHHLGLFISQDLSRNVQAR